MTVNINSSNIVSQVGASLINYYEIISFTPSIIGGTLPGAGTYTLQAGYYTKIGNLIFVQGSMTWTTHTGTGNMYVGNLPYKVRNVANYDPECIVRTDSIPWPAGTGVIFGEFVANQSYIQIVEDRSNAPELFLQMNGTGTLHFTGWYLT